MTVSTSLLDTRARQISVLIARIDRSGRHLRCRKYFNRVTKQKRARLFQALEYISDMRMQHGSSMASDLLVETENPISQNVPDRMKSSTKSIKIGWIARIKFFFLSLLKLLK